MHIMTNKYQINGASVLLYHGLLDGLAEKLGTDLLCLFSHTGLSPSLAGFPNTVLVTLSITYCSP